MTVFFHAVMEGQDFETLRCMLHYRADVNARWESETPLFSAIRQHRPRLVRLLLNWGADPNIVNDEDETPLTLAVRQGHWGIVDDLLRHDADPDLGDPTPLMRAVEMNDLEMVQTLLEAGADVNRSDMEGQTALHDALIDLHVRLIPILEMYGARWDMMDEAGMTPRDLIEDFPITQGGV